MALATLFPAHLPALQIVVPLLSAPLCILLRRGNAAWAFATLVSLAAFAMAVTLAAQVLSDGPISYALGGWPPPWGIEYAVDPLSAAMLVLISGIGAVTLLYGRTSVEAEIPADRAYLFYICYLLCLTGLLGMVITGDAFNVFVFLEISSLSSYAMISLGRGRRALSAAYYYLVMGTIGATFYVIGIGLLYMVTGTLNMADIAAVLRDAPVTRTDLVAVAFLVTGLSMKLALFPLHKWLPGAYAYAPTVVTTFLASTATKVSLYVLIRVLFTMLDNAPFFRDLPWAVALLPFAVLAMFSGSLVAIFQNDVKKLLAYSSVAQIGYMVLGVSLATAGGLAAGILHMLNHAVIKGALFMAVGAVMLRIGSVRIEAMQGLGRQMPWTMSAFAIAGLSLIGVPLTAGFVSKWYLMSAAFETGWWWLAVLIVASSLLAVIYVWRVVESAFLRPAPPGREAVREAPASMLVMMWVMVGLNLWFGIDTTYTVDVAQAAAKLLVGGAP